MRPNAVLIHTGTNDMNQPFDTDTAPTRLAGLIDNVAERCPDAAILVAKIISAWVAGTMSRINAFNEEVPGIVEMDSIPIIQGDIWYSAIVEAGKNGWLGVPVPAEINPRAGCCILLPVWYPKGEIVSGIGVGTGVRFGDIDGDGINDYLWVSSKGAVTAYLDTAGSSADEVVWIPQAEIASGDNRGKSTWEPQGEIASGVSGATETESSLLISMEMPVMITFGIGAAAGVRVADVNKDGRADYLWLSDEGAVTFYTNTQVASSSLLRWWPQGEIGSGAGVPRGNITFADHNGNGRTEGANPSRVTWVPQGEIASGIEEYGGGHFADLNGDGQADYLYIAPNGAGTIAMGVGGNGKGIRFADINGDGRVEYP
ncbi:hypothetical protein BDW59DRAFT_165267 [Aspergillus cavernicola]|uniref:SGNH hydrolase-type esterase domain-containing protein n=1 Tax=Aspergillus cavernicola TaxID=176166 RepID=A0ABR4HWD1_9EURO